MRILKKYELFKESIECPEGMEVLDKPGFENTTTAVLNLTDNPDGETIVKKVNQSQFDQNGMIRYSDVDGFEKPEHETSPFLKDAGEKYPISDVPNGLKVVYQGKTYKVVSKS